MAEPDGQAAQWEAHEQEDDEDRQSFLPERQKQKEGDLRLTTKHVDAPRDDTDWDEDRAMSTIKKQRESEKNLRAENRALKEKADRLDAIEAEKLSDQEKLSKRAEEAEAKATAADERLKQANLIAELAKPAHGLVDARAAAKLIEGVQYDDQGEPSNLTEILPAFVEQHPFLKGIATTPVTPAANIDGGAGRTNGPAPSLTADELRAAKAAGMSAERYAQMKTVGNVDEYHELEAASAAKQ